MALSGRSLAWLTALAALVVACAAAACGSQDTRDARRAGLIGLPNVSGAGGAGGDSDADECSVDTDCPGPAGACGAPKCYHGVCGLNNRPIGDPCDEGGGQVCDGAGQCVECMSGSHCASGICIAHVCAALSCDDGVQNSGETDVDCGGPCPTKCPTGAGCAVDSDCLGGACDADSKSCAPTCSDGAQNGGETDLDCGGPCPAKCNVGLHCSANEDCITMNCYEGHCYP